VSDVHGTVVYDGPALESGTMDVRDLAPALLAVGQLCEQANRVLNGNRATVSVQVKTGFRPGSFNVDLAVVQSILDRARDILVSENVTAGLNLAAIIGIATGVPISLFKLFKLLRGKPVESATTLRDGNISLTFFETTINNHMTIVVSPEVVKLYNDPAVREAAKKVVAPLARPGIDLFETRDAEGRTIEQITKDDLPSFSEEVAEHPVTESDFPTVLQIVKPSFDNDMMWMFSDGTTNFYVTIADREFLRQVQNRERRFAKGDLLKVILRVESFVSEAGQISNRRTILQVLNQIEPSRQIPLIDPDGE